MTCRDKSVHVGSGDTRHCRQIESRNSACASRAASSVVALSTEDWKTPQLVSNTRLKTCSCSAETKCLVSTASCRAATRRLPGAGGGGVGVGLGVHGACAVAGRRVVALVLTKIFSSSIFFFFFAKWLLLPEHDEINSLTPPPTQTVARVLPITSLRRGASSCFSGPRPEGRNDWMERARSNSRVLGVWGESRS